MKNIVIVTTLFALTNCAAPDYCIGPQAGCNDAYKDVVHNGAYMQKQSSTLYAKLQQCTCDTVKKIQNGYICSIFTEDFVSAKSEQDAKFKIQFEKDCSTIQDQCLNDTATQ